MTEHAKDYAGLVERLRSAKANGDPTKYTAFITVAEARALADLIVRLAEAERERDDFGRMLAPETLVSAMESLRISSEAGIEALRRLAVETARANAAESALATVKAEREAMRAELQQRDELLLLATHFQFNRHISVVSRGLNKWAVSNGTSVLNTDGEWEWEPMPSSRDDDFIARARFTFAEAVTRARALTEVKQ